MHDGCQCVPTSDAVCPCMIVVSVFLRLPLFSMRDGCQCVPTSAAVSPCVSVTLIVEQDMVTVFSIQLARLVTKCSSQYRMIKGAGTYGRSRSSLPLVIPVTMAGTKHDNIVYN